MIIVLTYDFKHKKTQDVLLRLKSKGHKNVTIIASPWKERKNYTPLFKHRPSKPIDISLDELCKNLDYKLIKSEIKDFKSHLEGIGNIDVILIGGAGILPESLVKNYKVINAHPAYLPYSKGLDALKWAIYKNEPIGVTTHFVSEKIDEGLIINQAKIELFYEDTFHALAYRQYDKEIEMLVDSIEIIGTKEKYESLEETSEHIANRRMPHHIELKMMDVFKSLRKKSLSIKEL